MCEAEREIKKLVDVGESEKNMIEQLEIRYVKLWHCRLWEDNYKLHDIGGLIESFYKYGFKDPPKWEPKLNGAAGGIVEGNGRITALGVMFDEKMERPRGVGIAESGQWLVPVLFGVDAETEAQAEAYGVDHNASVLSGGDYGLADHMRMWDVGFLTKLEKMGEGGELPVVFDGDAVGRMLKWEAAQAGGVEGNGSGGGALRVLKIELSGDELEKWQEMRAGSGLSNRELFIELVWGS